MNVVPLALEPKWDVLAVGQHVDVLMDVVIWGEKRSLCRTAISRKLIVLYGSFSKCPAVSVLGGRVIEAGRCCRITSDFVDSFDLFTLWSTYKWFIMK